MSSTRPVSSAPPLSPSSTKDLGGEAVRVQAKWAKEIGKRIQRRTKNNRTGGKEGPWDWAEGQRRGR